MRQEPLRAWVRSNGHHGDNIVQILYEQDVYRVDLSFVSSHHNVERHLLWPGSTYPTHRHDLLHRDMPTRMIATKASKALRHLVKTSTDRAISSM